MLDLYILYDYLSCPQVTRYTHIMGDCVPESLLPALSDFLNTVCTFFKIFFLFPFFSFYSHALRTAPKKPNSASMVRHKCTKITVLRSNEVNNQT